MARHFLQAWVLGARAVSLLPCIGGRTTEHALWVVGLSHRGSRLCVTDQGDVIQVGMPLLAVASP